MYCVVFPREQDTNKNPEERKTLERGSVFTLVPNLDLGVGVRTPEEEVVAVATQSADLKGGLFVCLPVLLIMGVR